MSDQEEGEVAQSYTFEQVTSFLVKDLKDVLQSFQLSTTGNKEELQNRLLDYLEDKKLLVQQQGDGAAPQELQAGNKKDEEKKKNSLDRSPPNLQELPPNTDANTMMVILQNMQQMHQQQMQMMVDMVANRLPPDQSTLQRSSSNESIGSSSKAIKNQIDWIYKNSIRQKEERIKGLICEAGNQATVKTLLSALQEGLSKLETFLSEKVGSMEDDEYFRSIDVWYQDIATEIIDLDARASRYIEDEERKKKEEEARKKAGSLPPNVEIPKLNNPDEFPTYWESFNNLIHTNEKVSKYWKYTYLRQGMKGEVKHVLDCLSGLVENYEAAIDLIHQRFGQPRRIIRHAVKSMVNSQIASMEPKSLRKSYDSLQAKYHTISKYQDKLDNPLDAVLMPILESKLPPNLKEDWERKLIEDSTEFSSVNNYFTWLFQEVQAKEVIQETVAKKSYEKKSEEKPRQFSAQALVTKQNEKKEHAYAKKKEFRKKENERKDGGTRTCHYCEKSSHKIHNCWAFQKLSVYDRHQEAKKRRLCFSCLEPFSGDHGQSRCEEVCPESECGKPHHQLLHLTFSKKKDKQESSSEEEDDKEKVKKKGTSVSIPVACPSQQDSFDSILPTARATLSDGVNEKEVRIAFDTMCERSFVTSKIASCMKLVKPTPIYLDVSGFGNSMTTLETKTSTFTLSPLQNSEMKVEFRATIKSGQICAKIGPVEIDFERCSHLKNLDLADEFPRKKEVEVDILIGLDYLFQFLGSEFVSHSEEQGLPVALESIFGYIVLGPNTICPNKHDRRKQKKESSSYVTTTGTRENKHSVSQQENTNLNEQLERFWKIESLGLVERKIIMTKEEQSAVQQHAQSLVYDEERYECTLPVRDDAPVLISNYVSAKGQLKALEKRHEKDNELKQNYDNSIMDYSRLNFAREATKEECEEFSKGEEYFHPHKEIIRKESVSTKLRSVFNPNSRDKNGNSLNDCILPGPGLQPDISKMMLRKRFRKIAIMGDIQKMFCQTKINPNCYKFQQFLWRSYKTSEPPRRYIMTRLMFGISASPFLAIATVRHHLNREDMKEIYHDACKIALENTYVDDVCAGGESDEEVIKLTKDLIDVFSKGGWKLTKFISNSKKVMDSIPEEDRLPNLVVELEDGVSEYGTTKALGIAWNVEKDIFTFTPSESLLKYNEIETKRKIVSKVSQIYDIFGFVSAFTIRAKILIQKLWLEKLGWDDPVEGELLAEYREWCSELCHLSEIEVPRYVTPGTPRRIELHAFGDASKDAYGSAIYVRVETQSGDIYAQLLIAKTRVAPLKSKSIPRLELLAAHSCATLMNFVVDSLNISVDEIYYWSDSEIVLAWLRKPSSKWKTFVANRVQDIHDQSDPDSWYKVDTADNPADILSRGMNLQKLASADLYWHGPEWLSLPKAEWPSVSYQVNENDIQLPQEEVATSALPVKIEKPFSLIERNEKFLRIKHVAAYMLRWRTISSKWRKRNSVERAKFGEELSVNELENAELVLLRQIQMKNFPDEYKALSSGEKISTKSIILKLDPRFDKERKLIIVGGRLQFSTLPEESKSQIILPSNDLLVAKIIIHIHQENVHAPIDTTFSLTRKKYWIVHGRRRVGVALRDENTGCGCITCRHKSTKPLIQKMGDLPAERVTVSPSFSHIGLDFTGALYLKGQDGKAYPAYVCLYTCASSRMVHLELCNNMTTEEFLLSLRRVLNRRGKCKTLESDNQSTFKKADKLLQLSFSRKLMQKLDNKKIENYLADNSITWNFITERSPFRGGYWERLNRSLKEPLRKVLGRSMLTYTEMYTLITDIEAMINQRPLTYISTDPNELEPITPAHLALGRPLGVLPDIPADCGISVSKRYQHLQALRNRLWLRWSREYLHTLQERQKWLIEEASLNIGDICLITEENTKRNTWPMGRVVALTESRDGLIRTVKLKTYKGFLNRPVQRLHLFEKGTGAPIEDNPESETKQVSELSNKAQTSGAKPKAQKSGAKPKPQNSRAKPKPRPVAKDNEGSNDKEPKSTRTGRQVKKPDWYGI